MSDNNYKQKLIDYTFGLVTQLYEENKILNNKLINFDNNDYQII